MYKGTRHTGRTWSYRANVVGSASFDTDEQCRAIVSKCRDTFIPLQLLRENDFEALDFTRVSMPPARVVGYRLRRGREKLEKLGVPQRLIFAAPAFLLIAPRLGGLLARLCRKDFEDVPVELRDLYAPIRENGATIIHRPSPLTGTTFFHVARDGTRTAFTSSTFRPTAPDDKRTAQASATASNPPALPTSGMPERVPGVRNTALSAAFQLALTKGKRKQSTG
jgi:hypothetical protein